MGIRTKYVDIYHDSLEDFIKVEVVFALYSKLEYYCSVMKFWNDNILKLCILFILILLIIIKSIGIQRKLKFTRIAESLYKQNLGLLKNENDKINVNDLL